MEDGDAREEGSEDNENCRVYVGNIDWKISWQELKDHMRAAGEVAFADIFEERNGRSKGCAIVEYTSAKDMQNAIDTLNDSQLGDRLIFVREDKEAARPSKGKGSSGKGGSEKGKGKGWKGDSEKGKGGYGRGGYGKGGKSSGSAPHLAPLRVGPSDKGHLLYVGNLPFRASWQDVKDVFKEYGDVIRVDVAADVTGRSKGYATVLYKTDEEAQAAIDSLNESDFQGRKLLVRLDNLL